jgi:hypothetical protein
MTKINRTKLIDRNYKERDTRLFIIATEGRETEKQYFAMFDSSRLKVEVLPTGADNKSAPEYVIERLDEFNQKYNLNSDDCLWLVFDVDRWGEEKLSQICREAKQKGYGLAISNPCFEVWLYLHFDDLDPNNRTCKDFEEKFRIKLGSYNKSNLNLDLFHPNIEKAIPRAKDLHSDPQQNWTPTIGSHIYRVVELLFEIIKPSTSI